jgi:hypothetical protein
VNAEIRAVAARSAESTLQWEFLCECGRPDCSGRVLLTLAEYEAIRDGGAGVLAAGHRRSQTARAKRLRGEASALKAQAKHQLDRARKNVPR